MRQLGILAAVLLAIVAIAAVTVAFRGTDVQVVEVTNGSIEVFVDERGRSRLPRKYEITMPQAGRIAQIDLQAGDAVEEGQTVAMFVQPDLRNAVAEAQAVVDRLSAAIQENDDTSIERSTYEQAVQFVESMVKTVAAARARVEAGEKRRDYAETALGRVRELANSGAASVDDLDDAELRYWEGQLNYRQDVLVAEAMQSIEAATRFFPKMVEDFIGRKGLTRAVLEEQRLEAEAHLSQVELQWQRGTMTAPVHGVVLERHVDNEQYLPAGTPLLTIGRLEELELEVDVLSEEAVRIEAGDPVRVYGPAVGRDAENGIPARVQRIHPAGFTKISSLGVEQQRVRVVIDLDDVALRELRANGVGVDYRVRVRIIADRADGVAVISRAALFRGPTGDWQAYVVRGGRARLQTVEVGRLNDELAEVTGGLRLGERVILAPPTGVGDGTRVRAIGN